MKHKLYYFLFLVIITASIDVYGQIDSKSGITPCTLDCSPTSWVLNLHLAPLLSSLESDKYKNEESKKLGLHGGVDLAYYLKKQGKLKIAVSLGINYSLLSVIRDKKFDDSVWTVDVTKNDVHLFERGSVSETQKVGAINFPLKLQFDYQIAPRLDLYLNGAYYYSLNISRTYSSSGVLTRKGYYPSTNCWVYDLEMPNSEFFYPLNKPVNGSGDLKLKNGTGVELGLGLKYKLSQKYTLMIGAKMITGTSSVSDYAVNPNFTYSNSSTHTLNTLMDRGDRVTPKAWGVEFGLSINLGKCNRNHQREVEIVKIDSIKPTIKDTTVLLVDTVKTVKSPIIEGKEDITSIPDIINVAFTDSIGNMMKTITNSDPTRTFTLPEVALLLKKGAKIKTKLNIVHLIEFDYNTDILKPESKRCIDQLVLFMKEQPNARVDIRGHTDNQGTAEYNKTLSEKRAKAALDYMVGNGVSAARLTSAGFGFEKPITTNETDEGRQKNRRVEFEINLN